MRYRVGIRLPEWIAGYVSKLFEGFLDFQRTGGAMELHFDQPSGGDLPLAPIDKNWQGDGLIVYRYTAKEAAAWKSSGIAVVCLSAEFPGLVPEFARVTLDNDLVGKAAYEHLSVLGLRDFVYIHESTRVYSAERLESFRNAVIAGGGHYHQIDVPASDFQASARPDKIDRCMESPIMALPRPCGIFCKDDIAAVWTLRLLRKLGIDCPSEMPVLGVSDDVVFCHTTQPPLSSISYPGRKIGYAASSLLRKMMEGEDIAANYRLMFPPESVVPRESTRHVILADGVVTRALEYIRETIPTEAVSVADLSRVVGVSREGLRQRFRSSLGHSPKKEIERLRCHYVTEQLRGSDLTLDAIAVECGFSGSDEVCRFIKRMTGKTPGAIRKER